MKIKVIDYGEAFASRSSALALRHVIEQAFERSENQSVQLDFAGVARVGFSFVDELFGVLYSTYATDDSDRHLSIVNAPITLQRAIDKSFAVRKPALIPNTERELILA